MSVLDKLIINKFEVEQCEGKVRSCLTPALPAPVACLHSSSSSSVFRSSSVILFLVPFKAFPFWSYSFYMKAIVL